MQTYKYRFPATGRLNMEYADAARKLENNLKDSPDCLMAWCIFPSDSAILDRVTFDLEDDYPFGLKAVNLYTYTQPFEGTEDDFRSCVAENLREIIPDAELGNGMECMGREGKTPDTLYHIAERKDLEAIMEKGIAPGLGKNSYKNYENYVYLSDEKGLAPWLSILPHLEDPVIVKVNAQAAAGIEQGRVYDDREYVDGGLYTEYRTTRAIPAQALSLMDAGMDRELLDNLEARLLTQIGKEGDSEEPERGYERFQRLDVREDDFSKAVETIPYQMTLADYGMKM